MQVLWLTGATGFLGQNLLKSRFVEDFYVVAVVRRGSTFSFPGVQVVPFDLLPVSSPPADIILHAATDYGRSGNSLDNVLNANIGLPLELVELAGSNLKSFVAIDSYYNKTSQIYQHLKNYCLSKRTLIDWLGASKHNFAINRIFIEHMYGPLDRKDKFIPDILDKLSKNTKIELTSGLQLRDFVFVEDVVEALRLICKVQGVTKHNEGYFEYEVGLGLPISIRQFVLAAKRIAGSSSETDFGALREREGEILESVANLSSLRSLGFNPQFDLEKGLELTWKAFTTT